MKYRVMFILFLIALTISFIFSNLYTGSTWQPEQSSVSGIIYKEVWNKEDQLVFEPEGKGIRILVTGIETEGINGKKVILKGKVSKPEGSRNPGGFDYKKYLYGKKVLLVIDNPEIKAISQGFSLRIAGSLVRDYINTALGVKLGNNFKGFVMGIMTGDTSSLDKDEKQWVRLSGISHIMAVSGTHVTYILKPVKRLLKRKRFDIALRSGLTLIPLFLFITIAGYTPSVLRAGVMCGCELLGKILDKRNDKLNSLGVAGLVCILINPFVTLDTGFILSFGAVLSGMIILPVIKKLIYKEKEIPGYMDGFLYGLSVNIGLIPIMLYSFNMFSPAGIVITLIAAPLSSFLCIAGYIFVLLYYLPFGGFLNSLAGFALTGVTALFENISKLGAAIPGMRTVTPGLLFFVIYYGAVAIICMKINKVKINTKLVCILLSFVVIFGIANKTYSRYKLKITWFDVGQGSSALVETVNGGKILIDGGKGYTDISNILWRMGISYVDLIILSHGDSDHVEGLHKVIEEHKVGKVIIPCNKEDEGAMLLKEKALNQNADIIELEGEYTFKLGDTIFELFSFYHNDSLNNSSVVVQLTDESTTVLLPGDLETEGEKSLIEKGLIKDCDVVTASHHGSKSGTGYDLLTCTEPIVGVISVGEGNIYGHPSKEVLERFRNAGSHIFRTDKDGAIIMTINRKGNMVFETWLKRESIQFQK